MLLPDSESDAVDGVHEPVDVGLGEASAEVARGGRVWEALGPQGIKEDLIPATDVEVFEPRATGEDVVGDGQDVITLVVGQVPLEEMEVVVDVFDQANLLGHEVDSSDAASGDGSCLLGDVVVDVGGGHDRRGSLDPRLWLEALGDSVLALLELAADSRAHSKTSCLEDAWGGEVPQLFPRFRRFSSFFVSQHERITLG